ncbi:MAG: hypothetical protein JW827_11540, partial [Spirochaetes bacterium]|nr:hypothetical protein [Spirochaetota bacterium]
MKKSELFAFICRILGLGFIIYTVLGFPQIAIAVSLLISDSLLYSSWSLIFMIIFPVLSFVIAYILLKYGELLSRIFVKTDKKVSFMITERNERSLFTLVMRIIGIVCLIKGIASSVKVIAQMIFKSAYQKFLSVYNITDVITALLFLLIGYYFFFGGKKIVD